MTQGNCNCISGVVGFWGGVQVEDALGHVLDLMLGSVAVADDGLLHLHGLVLVDGHIRLPQRQQDHTPALGNTNTGSHILTEKQFLNGHRIRLRLLQQLAHVVVNNFQTGRKIHPGRRGLASGSVKAKQAAEYTAESRSEP